MGATRFCNFCLHHLEERTRENTARNSSKVLFLVQPHPCAIPTTLRIRKRRAATKTQRLRWGECNKHAIPCGEMWSTCLVAFEGGLKFMDACALISTLHRFMHTKHWSDWPCEFIGRGQWMKRLDCCAPCYSQICRIHVFFSLNA